MKIFPIEKNAIVKKKTQFIKQSIKKDGNNKRKLDKLI